MNFTEAKARFDKDVNPTEEFSCFLPVHLTNDKKTKLFNKSGERLEEYYKWQFLSTIVHSGLFNKDYLGTEVQFPKGNKNSKPIKIDAAIFDDKEWFKKYEEYHKNKNNDSLEWLRKHLIAVIEFKNEDSRDINTVWDQQLKSYLKESQRNFCLGVLFDTEKLYLFRKENDKFIRYSDEFNTKGDNSSTKELSLHLPDPYFNLPSFEQIKQWSKCQSKTRAQRTINDLELISGVHSKQINDAMSNILRVMDSVSMINQIGFEIIIQILALKIFDEKQSVSNPNLYLKFYIDNEEKVFSDIADEQIQRFIDRIRALFQEASQTYYQILSVQRIDFRNISHIMVLIEVVYQLQDFSFVSSQKTDLYQLVFYKFATPFSKDNNAQFITPLPLIDFLVSIVNPRNNETVIDPTVGIADFLSVSYVNSNSKLNDNNIFGIDVDEQMVKLASLNMLLNGDGNAKILAVQGHGSILSKFDISGNLIQLNVGSNRGGNWEKRHDNKQLKKFDVVLTNPPFGEDRAFSVKDQRDLDIMNCYELWSKYNGAESQANRKIDLGVVFLENAYRILKENGRMGIVLSNSIASIDAHSIAREWLIDKMRIVAIFDLPPNVFAETGVNTTIIVAYKPNEEELAQLKSANYQVFMKNIKNVGYEIKTSKRVKYFSPIYKINYETFQTEIDSNGGAIVNEDFTETIQDFKRWCLGQEETLKTLFISES